MARRRTAEPMLRDLGRLEGGLASVKAPVWFENSRWGLGGTSSSSQDLPCLRQVSCATLLTTVGSVLVLDTRTRMPQSRVGSVA